MQAVYLELAQRFSQFTNDESCSFYTLHGFCTANVIQATDIAASERTEILLGDSISTDHDSELFDALIEQLQKLIDRQFCTDESVEFPITDCGDIHDESLMDWCTGFLQAHLINEDDWFDGREQEVSELLLPIMLGSGLFDEEQEFQNMLEDEALCEAMLSQIPEVITELYLLLNAP